jgi:hypothetical protein
MPRLLQSPNPISPPPTSGFLEVLGHILKVTNGLRTLHSYLACKKGRDKKTYGRTLEEFQGVQRAKKFPYLYRTRRYKRSRQLAASPILSKTIPVVIIIKHHPFNNLTPNGHFSGRTAPLTYRRCIFFYLFNRYTY